LKKILITGATGFIGKSLVNALLEKNLVVSIIVRNKTNIFSKKVNVFHINNFSKTSEIMEAIRGVDCIVHLAGEAHRIYKYQKKNLDEILKINTTSTINLAKYASKCGVKKFIFISSIGVNGNRTENSPFTEKDKPNPQDIYSISKYEAEQALLNISKNNDLKIVIIRPPLVYGLDAKGNFARLFKWITKNSIIPLPLGNIKNSRSYIAIDNLIDFIITCIVNPKADNQIFLISDNEKLSTTKLIKRISKLFNKKARLFFFPQRWTVFFAKLIGKEDDVLKLFSSLEIDSNKARKLLGWKPVTTMEIQLRKNEKNI
tara:strand:+ start:300 stop:1247 length:948 start_codon:yes stop_codon:yes gene_type:complete